MSIIEKNKDNINKLYENLYLKLKRSYRENTGFGISTDIIKELEYQDHHLIEKLIDDITNDIYFVSDKNLNAMSNSNSNPNNSLLIGKSIFYGSWNTTQLVKNRLLGLLMNSSIYNNFLKSPYYENNNSNNVKNQIDHYIKNSDNQIKMNDIFNKLILEYDDKDLINISEFFNTRSNKDPKKLGYKNYYISNKFVFGNSDIVINCDSDNINKYFNQNLESYIDYSKKSIAKARLELKVINESNENLDNKLQMVLENIKEYELMELELTKEFAIAGKDIKIHNQSKDDVMTMIYNDKNNLVLEKEVIEIKLNLINNEKNYLESIMNYHNKLIISNESKIEVTSFLTNVIMINNSDIDFFKEYYSQIIKMMSTLNEISKLELKISNILSESVGITNREIKDECLLSIFRILNASFCISRSDQIYDNIMLIKRSINEYDLELSNNIFNHNTIKNMMSQIDKYVSNNNNDNKFIQYTIINHLNVTLIITILNLINQEKNMGFEIFNDLRKNYFELDNKLKIIEDCLQEDFNNISDSFILLKTPESTVNYYYKMKDETNRAYQVCISKKHQLDSKLNQLRNSLGLEKKEKIHLKSHISDFIRFNVIFDNNTSDSGIIIRNDPIKMTLEESVSGTTPVIYSEALMRFYDDFKEKFITADTFEKKFETIDNKLIKINDNQLLGRPGPEGCMGPQGERGDIGLTGEEGEKGDIGLTGERGERGPKGERGPCGETGIRGPQGEKGSTGIRGPQGEQGPIGDPFTFDNFTSEQLKSLSGPKGDQGDNGDQGESFKYKDFTRDQLLLLKGKQGDRGLKGDTGIQGKQGKQGDQGEQGYRGIQGPRGERGPEGKVDVKVVADLAIEMDCLKKNVKDFVTTSCIKINNDIESKLSSSAYKEKLAEEISDTVYNKIKDKLLKDIFNANLNKK